MKTLIASAYLILSATICLGQSTLADAEAAHKAGNYPEAMEIATVLAEKGDHEAQYLVGIMFFRGDFGAANYDSALKWFQLAAQSGNANAQNNLGVMYAQGLGVEASQETGFSWFLKAAENGNTDAQFNIGKMYYYGDGADRSIEQSLHWLSKAKEGGHQEAILFHAIAKWEEIPEPVSVDNAGVVIVSDNGQDHHMTAPAEFALGSKDEQGVRMLGRPERLETQGKTVFVVRRIPLELKDAFEGLNMVENTAYLMPDFLPYSGNAFSFVKLIGPIDPDLTDKEIAAGFGVVLP